MKGLKDFLKDIVALAIIIGIVWGGYWGFKTYKSNQAKSDESYKVVTSRNKSYNGVYSLTKLDKKGKNTWCGLILYVVNDKVVSCAKAETIPVSKLRKALGDKYKNVPDRDLEYEAGFNGTEKDRKILDEITPKNKSGSLDIGFTRPNGDGKHIIGWEGEFVAKDKINFDKVLDIKTTYDYMVSCDIVPGYDEKSQEVWLSKLLKNPQSIYHKGYKLIRYKNSHDMDKNCPLSGFNDAIALNRLFNAGLE